MSVERFTEVFRAEHRTIRDLLLKLHDAFQRRDREHARGLLEELGAEAGPHFRYEEEALYPALTGLLGEEYIEELSSEHDRAIGTARQLEEFAAKDPIPEDDVQRALRYIRSLLPHVINCDGLAIMVEKLPEEEVDAILAGREESLREGLSLRDWAEKLRGRRPAAPSF